MQRQLIPAVAAVHSVTSTDGPNSTVGFRSGMPWRASLSLLSTGKDAYTGVDPDVFAVEKNAANAVAVRLEEISAIDDVRYRKHVVARLVRAAIVGKGQHRHAGAEFPQRLFVRVRWRYRRAKAKARGQRGGTRLSDDDRHERKHSAAVPVRTLHPRITQ